MPDWKEAASKAHDERGPVTESAAAIAPKSPTRHEARQIVYEKLLALDIVEKGVSLGPDTEDAQPHVDVDEVRFYIGQAGELWGHVKTDDGEHSWDMPIRTLADAGELLAHKADMDNGIHPAPRPEGPMEAEAVIGP